MGKVQWSLAFSSWITDGLPTFPAPCFRTRVNAPHPTSTDAEIHSAPIAVTPASSAAAG